MKAISLTYFSYREELGDQKALADEIGNAIANGPAAGEPIDEDELAEDLARLEQEDLDEKMLTTGTVPVLPTGPHGDCEFFFLTPHTFTSLKI